MIAFLVWGLMACSAVYWGVQLLAKPLPTRALPVSERSAATADLSRLLGAPVASTPVEAPPADDGRFKLLGVVAPKTAAATSAGEGVALIAVDGVPRTVRIGAPVDGEMRLLAVDARSARLGREGVASLNLQLAPPTAPSTGSLAPATPSATILGGRFSPQGQPQLQGQPMPPQQPGLPAQPPAMQPLLPQEQPPSDARGQSVAS